MTDTWNIKETLELKTYKRFPLFQLSPTRWSHLREGQLIDIEKREDSFWYRINTGIWVKTQSSTLELALLKSETVVLLEKQNHSFDLDDHNLPADMVLLSNKQQ